MWDNLDDLVISEIQIEWHLILHTAKSWVQRQKRRIFAFSWWKSTKGVLGVLIICKVTVRTNAKQ